MGLCFLPACCAVTSTYAIKNMHYTIAGGNYFRCRYGAFVMLQVERKYLE